MADIQLGIALDTVRRMQLLERLHAAGYETNAGIVRPAAPPSNYPKTPAGNSMPLAHVGTDVHLMNIDRADLRPYHERICSVCYDLRLFQQD